MKLAPRDYYYSSLKLFLTYGLYVNHQLDGSPLLVHAVEGRSHGLAQLLLEHGANPNANGGESETKTPLHRAVEYSDCNMARLLLAHGADVNSADSKGTRPLFQAILAEDHALIRLLIENGADVNAPVTGCPWDVPLRLARRCYYGKVMKFLIAAGAHICISDAEEGYLRKYIK
jgi:ankyrin repeat protein